MFQPDSVEVPVIIMTTFEDSAGGYVQAYVRGPMTMLDELGRKEALRAVVVDESSTVYGAVDRGVVGQT